MPGSPLSPDVDAEQQKEEFDDFQLLGDDAIALGQARSPNRPCLVADFFFEDVSVSCTLPSDGHGHDTTRLSRTAMPKSSASSRFCTKCTQTLATDTITEHMNTFNYFESLTILGAVDSGSYLGRPKYIHTPLIRFHLYSLAELLNC